MFEKASRMKLRFTTPKGKLSTEDLWDLPLTSPDGVSLDDLAKSLNKEIKDSGVESYVEKKSTTNKVLELKFSIVIHIIDTKVEENANKENAAVRRTKKEKLQSIIDRKRDNELERKSIEDLEKNLKLCK